VWQRTAAVVKLHTLLSLRGPVPTWAAMTEAGVPDLKMLDQHPLQSGVFYVLDRGYLDFTRLARLHAGGVFFVVRSKCPVRFRVLASRAVDKPAGLRCDQTVRLTSSWSRRRFPGPLRRVRVRDATTGRSLVLLGNHFTLSAGTVAELYRRRWQVELFFKWINDCGPSRAGVKTPCGCKCGRRSAPTSWWPSPKGNWACTNAASDPSSDQLVGVRTGAAE